MAEDRDVFIGQLDGRLQSLEGQVSSLEGSVQTGFANVHRRLDELFAAENQRKGVMNALKALFTGGVLTALWEGVKSLFAGGHHG